MCIRDSWKNWLKGVVDGRPPLQALLVTGSARMETWRQSGDSLAGRYLAYRLHPLSVRAVSYTHLDVYKRQVLVRLEPLLICDDTASAELFEANRPLLLATHGAGAVKLGQQIGDFDYPAALTTLRELLR